MNFILKWFLKKEIEQQIQQRIFDVLYALEQHAEEIVIKQTESTDKKILDITSFATITVRGNATGNHTFNVNLVLKDIYKDYTYKQITKQK